MIALIKDYFMDICRAIYSKLSSSAILHFVKDRYLNLSFLHRKILRIVTSILLLFPLLYYPSLFLYSSWRNIHNTQEKEYLIKQLNHISFAVQHGASFSQSIHSNLVSFIRSQISQWSLAKGQIISVQEGVRKNIGVYVKGTSIPSRSVEIKIDNLNLKEVVDYAKKLESLSPYFKLIGLHMVEDKSQADYFDVFYIIAFLNNLRKQDMPAKRIHVNPDRAKEPAMESYQLKKGKEKS